MYRDRLSLLLAIATTLATSLPASAQLSSEVNPIAIGAGILNSLLNPPHRAAEIKAEAEVKKANIIAEMEIEKEKLRIAADKVTPLLAQWGVSRVSCAPGLVFINDIEISTICIEPTKTIAAGYYTYNNQRHQLLRNSGTVGGKPAPLENRPPQSLRSIVKVTVSGNLTTKGF